ncbi:surface-adhesin E family protein [Polynucleobacter corsicus]|uniref:surface-adhesin E family protein n=1 Tax=Polynucleobacter corsicus TaxID=2081042 RepID=UPI001BFD4578|nr:surface-adhesin E family protein [Polynucleobacter corsicus]QWE19340.1 hypothetical protein C2747_03685 [Polynucleobacter corsicus]
MKKVRLTLLIALTLTSLNAAAEWSAIDEEKGVYFDTASIQTEGQLVKVWALQNYKKALPLGNKVTRSKKIFLENNCLNSQIRTLAFSFMTEEMGEGYPIPGFPLISTSSYAKWRAVEPNSFYQILFNKVCRPSAPSANQSLQDGEEIVAPNAAPTEDKNRI